MSELTTPPWNTLEKVLFRFSFLFFSLLLLPLDIQFFQTLSTVTSDSVFYGTLFELVRYSPQFLGEGSQLSSLIVLFIIALIGTVIWNQRDSEATQYHKLYYGLRVAVRYRLAAALIVYAIIKLYPLQSPEPSISNLNTAYGDFTDWKLFSLTLGVVPEYQSFLGLTELIAALLLLYRPTATIATLIIIPFTGNVFFSNLAYGGGEAYYSFYLLLLAGYLLTFDLRRLYTLIAEEQPTLPAPFKPLFTKTWQQISRYSLKGTFLVIFVFWYGYEAKAALANDPYQFPSTQGLPHSAGIYNVKEFKLNNQTLPYSAIDPVRWKDVVFENWSTISIRSNKPVIIDSSNVEHIYRHNHDRNYEFSGSGGRHYFAYTVDEAKQTLQLLNRNPHHKGEALTLSFSRPDSTTFILEGINETQDSIYVVLEKTPKKYLIEEVKKVGRRGSLKL